MLLGSTYKTKDDSKSQTCPICLVKRKCISGHLLRYHNVSKKSESIKGLKMNKADATHIVAEGIYRNISHVIEDFERDYFGNLDGSTKPVKPETEVKTRRKKVQTVRKICYWIGMWTKKTYVSPNIQPLLLGL